MAKVIIIIIFCCIERSTYSGDRVDNSQALTQPESPKSSNYVDEPFSPGKQGNITAQDTPLLVALLFP